MKNYKKFKVTTIIPSSFEELYVNDFNTTENLINSLIMKDKKTSQLLNEAARQEYRNKIKVSKFGTAFFIFEDSKEDLCCKEVF